MPNLVATKSALARTTGVRTHFIRTNNAKFSVHYVCPRTHNMHARALFYLQLPAEVHHHGIFCAMEIDIFGMTRTYINTIKVFMTLLTACKGLI